MADTGAPHFIPYVEPTDLVRDYPAADEAQAEAVADALDVAGGLVAVKTSVKTSALSQSLASNATVVPAGLTIEHAVSDVANRVLLFGTVMGSSDDLRRIAWFFTADGNPILIGDQDGSRGRMGAQSNAFDGDDITLPTSALVAVHTPGTLTSVTYAITVRNFRTLSDTVFVNRSKRDNNTAADGRGVSTITLMEVRA